MKHFSAICLFVIVFASLANAQDCKVPISVQLKTVSTNTRNNKKDLLGNSFMDYLERHGFTTEIQNTRVAISLMLIKSEETCSDGNQGMDANISFIDAFTGNSFYSTQLTKYYCGDSIKMRKELANDFANPMPEMDSLAEAIHNCVIDAFEVNTKHMADVAQGYATQGDHDIALYALLQYPTCCQSYPKIRNFMVAIFRDYTQKNHKVLFKVAKSVWKNRETDADARFVVSLLKNDTTLNKWEQMKADRLLRKVAKEYPSINMNVKEDYTIIAELKAIALREARAIGIDYSNSYDFFPETNNFIPSYKRSNIRPYYNDNDFWYDLYMDSYHWDHHMFEFDF